MTAVVDPTTGVTFPDGSVQATAFSKPGTVLQTVEAVPIVALATSATLIPYDDTIPQITEGVELMTVTITPKSATNRLRIEFDGVINCSTSAGVGSVALFQDATANALTARGGFGADSGKSWNCGFSHEMVAGTTSATTFRVRFGPDGGTAYINGNAARKFGGVQAARLRVTEIAV